MSTGDSVIPHAPWFDKLHSRRQKFMKMFYHQSLRLTRLLEPWTIPSVAKRWRSDVHHPIAETPTIPSVAKRWRSGTRRYRRADDPIRCIPRLLFRQQRLHNFGGAQVFCVLCVHFEDFETHNQIPRNV